MSNESQCPKLSEGQESFQRNLNFFIYYIIMPIYFFVGMSGSVTLLLAFYKQTKTDKAYGYQIFLTVSKACEIFFSSIFWWGYKWYAGIEAKPGNAWYMRQYALMFYSAHVGCPLSNGFIITSLLCSVAMTADRIFALSKPFVYKNIDTQKHQILAAIGCAVVGLGTSVFEIKRWAIRSIGSGESVSYELYFDDEYLSTQLAMTLGHLRTGLRLINLIGLIILNIVMAAIFLKHSKKVGNITVANERKEKERRAAEKNLLVLTIYQSCLMAFAHVPHSMYFVVAFMAPSFDTCYGGFVAPIVDGCICLADTADLFVIIGLNKKMRRTVFKVLPCCKKDQSTTTIMGTAISVSQANTVKVQPSGVHGGIHTTKLG